MRDDLWISDPGFDLEGNFLPSIFEGGTHQIYGVPGTAISLELKNRPDGRLDLIAYVQGVPNDLLTKLLIFVFKNQAIGNEELGVMGMLLVTHCHNGDPFTDKQ